MNSLDLILPLVTIASAVLMMYYRYKKSGEPFDSFRFGFCLLLVAAIAAASAGTSHGDNVTVTVSGLIGEIIRAVTSGLGVVYFFSVATGRK